VRREKRASDSDLGGNPETVQITTDADVPLEVVPPLTVVLYKVPECPKVTSRCEQCHEVPGFSGLT